jgi:hypothetical protein
MQQVVERLVARDVSVDTRLGACDQLLLVVVPDADRDDGRSGADRANATHRGEASRDRHVEEHHAGAAARRLVEERADIRCNLHVDVAGLPQHPRKALAVEAHGRDDEYTNGCSIRVTGRCRNGRSNAIDVHRKVTSRGCGSPRPLAAPLREHPTAPTACQPGAVGCAGADVVHLVEPVEDGDACEEYGMNNEAFESMIRRA